MRSLTTYIILYALLTVSVLSVLPWGLMSDIQQDQISFFEGENEKEKEQEKEDNESKKENRKKNEKKDNKFLCSIRIVDVVLYEHSLRSPSLKFEWDSHILAVLSPPPEEMLG